MELRGLKSSPSFDCNEKWGEHQEEASSATTVPCSRAFKPVWKVEVGKVWPFPMNSLPGSGQTRKHQKCCLVQLSGSAELLRNLVQRLHPNRNVDGLHGGMNTSIWKTPVENYKHWTNTRQDDLHSVGGGTLKIRSIQHGNKRLSLGRLNKLKSGQFHWLLILKRLHIYHLGDLIFKKN